MTKTNPKNLNNHKDPYSRVATPLMVMQTNKKKKKAQPFLVLLSNLMVIRVFLEPKNRKFKVAQGLILVKLIVHLTEHRCLEHSQQLKEVHYLEAQVHLNLLQFRTKSQKKGLPSHYLQHHQAAFLGRNQQINQKKGRLPSQYLEHHRAIFLGRNQPINFQKKRLPSHYLEQRNQHLSLATIQVRIMVHYSEVSLSLMIKRLKPLQISLMSQHQRQ